MGAVWALPAVVLGVGGLWMVVRRIERTDHVPGRGKRSATELPALEVRAGNRTPRPLPAGESQSGWYPLANLPKEIEQ